MLVNSGPTVAAVTGIRLGVEGGRADGKRPSWADRRRRAEKLRCPCVDHEGARERRSMNTPVVAILSLCSGEGDDENARASPFPFFPQSRDPLSAGDGDGMGFGGGVFFRSKYLSLRRAKFHPQTARIARMHCPLPADGLADSRSPAGSTDVVQPSSKPVPGCFLSWPTKKSFGPPAAT
nr:hypothetical protein CFP56_53602 [Quercus suber]